MNRGAPVRLRTLPAPRQMTPTPSPMQPDSLGMLGAAIQKIETFYKEFQNGLELVKKALATFESVKQGKPGMPGSPGSNGRNVTKEDVDAAVQKLFKNPEGPTPEEVAMAVMQSGTFYKLIKRHLKQIKAETPQEEKLEMETIMIAVREEISSRRFTPNDIEGFSQHVETISRRMRAYDPSPGNARGGGDTVVAGTGVTIRETINGNKEISVIATGITLEIPAGLVNALNTVFTPTEEPLYVISDGVTYFDGAGYTWNGTTITMDIAPSQYIRDAISS